MALRENFFGIFKKRYCPSVVENRKSTAQTSQGTNHEARTFPLGGQASKFLV